MFKHCLFFTSTLWLGLSACSLGPDLSNDVQASMADLPRDEAPHPKNSLEWWYFTGHLYNADSSRVFGVEWVIFHTTPQGSRAFLIANVALSDPQNQSFSYDYQFEKQNKPLASDMPLQLKVGKESVMTDLQGAMGQYALKAQWKDEATGWHLHTSPEKGLLLHDGTGYEDYGGLARAGYYSFPRLKTAGVIWQDGDSIAVQGHLWYDRQWDCLGVWDREVAWDWMSIQLENPAADLMVYRLTKNQGDSVLLTGGTYFSAEEEQIELGPEDIELTPQESWLSAKGDRAYPVAWRLCSDTLDLDLQVNALLPASELELAYLQVLKVRYWEGMCTVRGTLAGDSVQGNSYLEMTNR